MALLLFQLWKLKKRKWSFLDWSWNDWDMGTPFTSIFTNKFCMQPLWDSNDYYSWHLVLMIRVIKVLTWYWCVEPKTAVCAGTTRNLPASANNGRNWDTAQIREKMFYIDRCFGPKISIFYPERLIGNCYPWLRGGKSGPKLKQTNKQRFLLCLSQHHCLCIHIYHQLPYVMTNALVRQKCTLG